jgi:hypothetical protein
VKKNIGVFFFPICVFNVYLYLQVLTLCVDLPHLKRKKDDNPCPVPDMIQDRKNWTKKKYDNYYIDGRNSCQPTPKKTRAELLFTWNCDLLGSDHDIARFCQKLFGLDCREVRVPFIPPSTYSAKFHQVLIIYNKMVCRFFLGLVEGKFFLLDLWYSNHIAWIANLLSAAFD